MYNRDKSVLYFASHKLSDFSKLGIHYFTLKTHLKKRTYYLKRYSFSNTLDDKAKIKILSLSELNLKLKKDRLSFRRR